MSKRKLYIGNLPPREVIKPVKINGIMNNGLDNAYPTRIDRLIEGSVTAKASSDMLARFLVGDGFVDESLNDIVVGKQNYRPVTLYRLLSQMARSTSRHGGYFVRGGFDIDLNTAALKIENFKNCRFSIQDDTQYSGRIVVYNNWDKAISQRIEKGKFILVDVWNKNKDIIRKQIEKAGSLEKYRGQMFFDFIEDDYLYPLSPFDTVSYDMDTEDQISKFINGELRGGFYLKYIMHHTNFTNETEAEDFMDKMAEFNGGDHESNMLVLAGSFDETGKLIDGENVKIEKLEQNINDKLFEGYSKQIANNIRKAADAIPQVLIDYEVSQLGSTSGEAIKQAAEYYNQQTAYKRAFLEDGLRAMFANWKDERLRNASFEIKPLSLTEDEISLDIAGQKRIESQATLKGSVGGVTALLELQKAVSEGTADLSAAVAIIREIYGINDEIAKEMLGTPKIIEDGTLDNNGTE